MKRVEAREIFMNYRLHFKLLNSLLPIQDLNTQVRSGIVTFCSVSNRGPVNKLIHIFFL